MCGRMSGDLKSESLLLSNSDSKSPMESNRLLRSLLFSSLSSSLGSAIAYCKHLSSSLISYRASHADSRSYCLIFYSIGSFSNVNIA